MVAPGRAAATVWPAATLGAPQTMVRAWPVPVSTWHTVSRSASGCLSAARTLPTTKPSSEGTPMRSIHSSSVPVRSRRSAMSAADRPGSQ